MWREFKKVENHCFKCIKCNELLLRDWTSIIGWRNWDLMDEKRKNVSYRLKTFFFDQKKLFVRWEWFVVKAKLPHPVWTRVFVHRIKMNGWCKQDKLVQNARQCGVKNTCVNGMWQLGLISVFLNRFSLKRLFTKESLLTRPLKHFKMSKRAPISNSCRHVYKN